MWFSIVGIGLFILVVLGCLSIKDKASENKARKQFELAGIGISFDQAKAILGNRYKILSETEDTKQYQWIFKNTSIVASFVNGELKTKELVATKSIKKY